MRLRGPLDAALDGVDFIFTVLRGVVRVVDVTPCRADMVRGVDRVLVVDRIGELDVAVLVLAPLGVHVISSSDPIGHLSHSLRSPVCSRPPRTPFSPRARRATPRPPPPRAGPAPPPPPSA